MSIEAWKWASTYIPPKTSPKMKSIGGAELFVLCIFADYADEQGRASYPSQLTVAYRARCTERNVTEIVKKLVDAGLLVKSPDQSPAAGLPADNRPIVYDLPINLVRPDTIDQWREEKRARLAERAEKRRQKKAVATGGDTDDAIRTEVTRNNGPKQDVTTDRSTAHPRTEVERSHGPNHSSDKPSFKPSTDPSLNPSRAKDDRKRQPRRAPSEQELMNEPGLPRDRLGWPIVRELVPDHLLTDATCADLCKRIGLLLREGKPEDLVRKAVTSWATDPKAEAPASIGWHYTKVAKAATAEASPADDPRARLLARIGQPQQAQPAA
ncbi:helix-turn-helix domain-containing protein [Nocardia sp. CY41]|uniref:helix-turn-helix domain-containing protein n=1 Tax=Nocardia sp. CY41 TaxID=2608686 RepID=UPI00135997E5|nr:helix-turn-helix domain-containing protein [Nocardia sp. CY41]